MKCSTIFSTIQWMVLEWKERKQIFKVFEWTQSKWKLLRAFKTFITIFCSLLNEVKLIALSPVIKQVIELKFLERITSSAKRSVKIVWLETNFRWLVNKLLVTVRLDYRQWIQTSRLASHHIESSSHLNLFAFHENMAYRKLCMSGGWKCVGARSRFLPINYSSGELLSNSLTWYFIVANAAKASGK